MLSQGLVRPINQIQNSIPWWSHATEAPPQTPVTAPWPKLPTNSLDVFVIITVGFLGLDCTIWSRFSTNQQNSHTLQSPCHHHRCPTWRFWWVWLLQPETHHIPTNLNISMIQYSTTSLGAPTVHIQNGWLVWYPLHCIRKNLAMLFWVNMQCVSMEMVKHILSGPPCHLVCSLQTEQSCIGIHFLYLKPRGASCIPYLLGLTLGWVDNPNSPDKVDCNHKAGSTWTVCQP